MAQYAHFAEIMPEVRRGYYRVSRRAGDFRLDHRSPEFARFELRDTLLGELALPFSEPPAAPRRALREALVQSGRITTTAHLPSLRALARLYLNTTFEVPLLTGHDLSRAIGATYGDFERFRSALMAIADYALAHAAADVNAGGEPAESAVETAIGWVAPCWPEDDFIALVSELSGLDPAAVDRLVTIFALDYRNGKADSKGAGDGYLPPLLRLPGAVVAPGDLIRAFIQTRNVLYTLNERNRTQFDEIVSDGLEPQLLRQAADCFERIPSLLVRRNEKHARGEFDLIVYEAATNTALHVQAKGSVPAQGARMVRNLESRVSEGLRQLSGVRALPAQERDAVLSRALGTAVRDVEVLDCVLCRAGFGTQAVYANNDHVTFLTLAVLAAVVERYREAARMPSLSELLAACRRYVDDLVTGADARWDHAAITLGETRLDVPLLHYDEAFVNRERRRAFRALSSPSATAGQPD